MKCAFTQKYPLLSFGDDVDYAVKATKEAGEWSLIRVWCYFRVYGWCRGLNKIPEITCGYQWNVPGCVSGRLNPNMKLVWASVVGGRLWRSLFCKNISSPDPYDFRRCWKYSYSVPKPLQESSFSPTHPLDVTSRLRLECTKNKCFWEPNTCFSPFRDRDLERSAVSIFPQSLGSLSQDLGAEYVYPDKRSIAKLYIWKWRIVIFYFWICRCKHRAVSIFLWQFERYDCFTLAFLCSYVLMFTLAFILNRYLSLFRRLWACTGEWRLDLWHSTNAHFWLQVTLWSRLLTPRRRKLLQK